MFLKQGKPEMDDFERKKYFGSKNTGKYSFVSEHSKHSFWRAPFNLLSMLFIYRGVHEEGLLSVLSLYIRYLSIPLCAQSADRMLFRKAVVDCFLGGKLAVYSSYECAPLLDRQACKEENIKFIQMCVPNNCALSQKDSAEIFINCSVHKCEWHSTYIKQKIIKIIKINLRHSARLASVKNTEIHSK